MLGEGSGTLECALGGCALVDVSGEHNVNLVLLEHGLRLVCQAGLPSRRVAEALAARARAGAAQFGNSARACVRLCVCACVL